MRVAVIRQDLSKSLFIADLEPKSQANATVEPPLGQNRYVSRPDPVAIQAYLNAQGLIAVAATLITATVPVAPGPVDVSSGAITGVAGLGGATAAQVAALQDLLAPHFVETDVAKKSFLFGNLAGFRSASFNPDPRKFPTPPANGAAITVVQDDGVTPFAVAQPVIAVADKDTPLAGDLRITGTGLVGYGLYTLTVILLGVGARKLTQAQILAGGGAIAANGLQIDIPAALVPGIALTTTTARVQVNDMLSAAVALT